MEIIYFDELNSTQKFLIDKTLKGDISPSTLIWTKNQTDGIGSRDNLWEGGDGNLFLSFVLDIKKLPEDLPLASASIYFSYIMKEVLSEFKEGIFVKWPNDLYIESGKVGGIITKKIDNLLICGIGINLKDGLNQFNSLKLDIEPIIILNKFTRSLENRPSWEDVFNKYSIEFDKNRDIFATINNKKLSLKEANLERDGSITINNRKIYSLR